MIKIIVIRYRIIKITVIVIIQLIIQYLRHMLFRQGQWIFDQLYFFRFYRLFLEIRWLFLREFLGLQILYFSRDLRFTVSVLSLSFSCIMVT